MKNQSQLIKHPGLKSPRKPRNSTPPVQKIPHGYLSTQEIADAVGRTPTCILTTLERRKVPKVRFGRVVYWDGELAREYIREVDADVYDHMPNGYIDIESALELTGFKSAAYLSTLFKRGKVRRIRYRDDMGAGRKTRFAYNVLDLETLLSLNSDPEDHD
jgi:hypothetical protein